MSNKIEGKVVVIRGASSGLGAGRADRLQSLADELTGSGGKALAVRFNVEQVFQIFEGKEGSPQESPQ